MGFIHHVFACYTSLTIVKYLRSEVGTKHDLVEKKRERVFDIIRPHQMLQRRVSGQGAQTNLSILSSSLKTRA